MPHFEAAVLAAAANAAPTVQTGSSSPEVEAAKKKIPDLEAQSGVGCRATRLAKIVAHFGDLMVEPIVGELARLEQGQAASAVTVAIFEALDKISAAVPHFHVCKMAFHFWSLVGEAVHAHKQAAGTSTNGSSDGLDSIISPYYFQFVNRMMAFLASVSHSEKMPQRAIDALKELVITAVAGETSHP